MISPILNTCVYVLSPDRTRLLLMHRNKSTDDWHFGKYLGLGGKVEAGEDVVTCAQREVAEESGLTVESMVLRGTVLWPGFAGPDRNVMGFIFRVDAFSGEPHQGNREGTLEWVPIDRLTTLPMWESDHEWLPMVLDADPRQFHGVMPYQDGKMVAWSFQRIAAG